jgi:hypothetical protein
LAEDLQQFLAHDHYLPPLPSRDSTSTIAPWS